MSVIEEVSIALKASQCLEPMHPIFPSLEVFVSVKSIEMYFSDYVMHNIFKIKEIVMPPIEPKPEESKVSEPNSDSDGNMIEDENGDLLEDDIESRLVRT